MTAKKPGFKKDSRRLVFSPVATRVQSVTSNCSAVVVDAVATLSNASTGQPIQQVTGAD